MGLIGRLQDNLERISLIERDSRFNSRELVGANQAVETLRLGAGIAIKEILAGIVDILKRNVGFSNVAVCTHDIEYALENSGLSKNMIYYTFNKYHKGIVFDCEGISIGGGEGTAQLLLPEGGIYDCPYISATTPTDGSFSPRSLEVPCLDLKRETEFKDYIGRAVERIPAGFQPVE